MNKHGYDKNNANRTVSNDVIVRFGDRLKKSMKGESNNSLSRRTGLSEGLIRKYIKGESYPALDNLVSLVTALNVPIDWLVMGDVSPYIANSNLVNNNEKLHSASQTLSISKEYRSNSFSIDYLDVTASAGNGFYSSDAKAVVKVIDYDLNEAKLLFGHLKQEHLKIINIAGDSMQPTFQSGDLIFVDISRNVFEGDGIYVFTFGRGLYVKRLQLIKNTIKVISDNETYSDWEIAESELDQLCIHGKVMLSQSSLLRKHG